ncbi:MAG: family 16 glycoside hydrolase [Planctomycetota bacterium]|nr:family 16 glycoside hydrolase [Planctomycetota bacterium]
MYRFQIVITTALLSLAPCISQDQKTEQGFVPLFNGKNLNGWQRVNTAESTWTVREGQLICSGKPIGELRTTRMYQNFILEVEWRHMKPRGNAGIFVWADDITAKGVPFHRSIEVQVLENAYGNTRGYTTHGDIFPIHGAKMEPVNGRGGKRAFPTENRSNPSPQWNHYRIDCRDGKISLAVNGKVVTRGTQCNPRKGYICIESEGGIVHYRNLNIKVLPDTPIPKESVAISDRGFRSLYNGIQLDDWHVEGDWQPNDWQVAYRGKTAGSLTSKKEYGEASFIVDFRSSATLPLFEIRGLTINPAKFKANLLAKGKGWNRLQIHCDSSSITVEANGQPAIETVPVHAKPSPLKITATAQADLANFYVRETKR